MTGQSPSSTKPNLYNLIAIGAFFYYFLRCLNNLIDRLVDDLGVLTGLNPTLFFWGGMVLNLLIIVLVLRIWVQKIWKKMEDGSISTKPILIKFTIAIVAVHIAQFADVYFVSTFLIEHHYDSFMAYYIGIELLDEHGIIQSLFTICLTTLTLILFIRWK